MAVSPDIKARYNEFLKDRATPVMAEVGERMKEVCTAVTREKVSARKAKVEEYATQGNQKMAQKEVEYLKKEVEKNPIVSRCSPMKEELAKLVNEEMPALVKRAGDNEDLRILAGYYPNIARGWNDAQSAFKDQTEAPGFLEGSQGSSDFKRAVAQSLAAVQKLESNGTSGNTLVTTLGNQQVSLDVAAKLVKTVNGELDSLIAKVKTHNENLRKGQRKAWEDKNLKGEMMKAVYEQNNKRIPKQENLGDTLIWTYRSYTTGALFHDCKEYTFNGDGSTLVNRRVFACE
jgi:hypothetical protein